MRRSSKPPTLGFVRRFIQPQSAVLFVAVVATTALCVAASPQASDEASNGNTATVEVFHNVVKATLDADSFIERQGSAKILYESPDRGEVVSSATGHQ